MGTDIFNEVASDAARVCVAQPELYDTHTGNCIMRGAGKALVFVGPQRTDVSDFCENLLQLDKSTTELLPASFHKENVTNIESGSRNIVNHSLQVLDEWTQSRAGHIVIEQPDGSPAICIPSRYEATTLQFCTRLLTKGPKTREMVTNKSKKEVRAPLPGPAQSRSCVRRSQA